MGTKNNPGAYDCYSKAEPDEPMFVLLARDPSAPLLVCTWVELNPDMPMEKIMEAYACADAMEAWRSVNRTPIKPLDPDLQEELGHHGPKSRDLK